jgi:secreted Zn-dependent insulinase-like peptidase
MEETVWYLDNYVDEMEGDIAKRHPLTMQECAKVVEESFTGRIQCEALCMGNIDQAGAEDVAKLIQKHFVEPSRPLSEVEIPSFRSLKLPTRDEAKAIYGPEAAARSVPTIYADLAASESEENNAVELVLQAGSELELGYEGMAVLDLISHISYTSAYNQLRTIEQLGYLVSAFARKTAGNSWAMSVVVQSSTHLPDVLQERCENWLLVFRAELGAMSADSLAAEASAVVAQLLEDETKLSQEVGRNWGEILNTESLTDSLRTPSFDRLERLAAILEEGQDESGVVRGEAAQRLKNKVLAFFDRHFAVTSPSRRAMSAMVYSQRFKADFESIKSKPGVVSSFADIRHTKQFLASWPTIPYWRIDLSPTTKDGMKNE